MMDKAKKDSTGEGLDRSNGMKWDIKRWEGIGQLDYMGYVKQKKLKVHPTFYPQVSKIELA